MKDAYIDDVISTWGSNKQEINLFIEQTIIFHPTFKLTAEMSENKINPLSLPVRKGNDLKTNLFLTMVYITSLLKLYTHLTSSQPTRRKKRFLTGKLRLLRANSSETTFEESLTNFKSRLIARLQKVYIQKT